MFINLICCLGSFQSCRHFLDTQRMLSLGINRTATLVEEFLSLLLLFEGLFLRSLCFLGCLLDRFGLLLSDLFLLQLLLLHPALLHFCGFKCRLFFLFNLKLTFFLQASLFLLTSFFIGLSLALQLLDLFFTKTLGLLLESFLLTGSLLFTTLLFFSFSKAFFLFLLLP